MSARKRLGRLSLVVGLGAATAGLGVSTPAGADEAQCVTNYLSRGRSVVVGPSYSIPYQSIAGAPYVENEINARPVVNSFATNAYEGWIGDIVLGTSGVYPRNPMAAYAHWPPLPHAENGGATNQKDSTAYGPFANSSAAAGPRSADGTATAFGQKMSKEAGIGPSIATSHAEFDGQQVKGVDEVIGYDLTFGPLSIKKLRSVVEYASDGTKAGTKGNWLLEFSGVGGDSDKVYTITKDGFAPAGGDPAGGSSEMKAFNEGAEQFADALEQAGIGRSAAKIADGTIELDAGELLIRTAGLKLSMDFTSRNDQIGDSQGIFFGYQERYAKVEAGDCAIDVNGFELDKYQDAESGAHEIGPIRAPDPTPPGYGGPESVTPPVPVPESVHEAKPKKSDIAIPPVAAPELEAAHTSTRPISTSGPLGVTWLVAALGLASFVWAAKSLWRFARPGPDVSSRR